MATLVFGVGNVWGAEAVYKTAMFGSSYNSKGVQNYTSSWSSTTDGFTVNLQNFNNNNNGWAYVKCGSKSAASVATIITDAAIDEAVTKVAVTIDAITADNVNSIKLYTSTNGTSWTVAGTYDKSTGDKEVSLASPTENLYYKLEFDCKKSSNGVVQVSKVEYYYTQSPLTSIALSGSYPTEFYVGKAFSHEGMTVTAHYENGTEKNVTEKATFTGYDMSSLGSQTVTVSYTENEVTKTETYGITVIAIPTHTASFSVNGAEVSSSVVEEGADIDFPADPADLGGKKFVGWAAATISGTTDEEPAFVSSAVMGKADVTYYAVFATVTPGGVVTVVDNLTRATTGVSGTNYSGWTNKKVTSDAVYAGRSAGGNDAIQLRTSGSNEGIVSTTSGGKIKKVEITWNNNTSNGRKVNIYGSNTAYTGANQLYATNTQGTLLGTLEYDTDTELDITGDYAYIGIRSDDSALYLAKVAITWETVGPDTYSAYCTTVPNTVPLEITDAGFATYCSAYALDFSGVAGLTAYQAGMEGTTVKFTPVSDVPAETGVLVKGAEGTYNVPVVASSSTDVDDNVLVGTVGGTTINGNDADYFVLKKNTAGVGFYRVTNSAYNVRANTAYLAVPKGSAKGFIPVDGTTAIELVDTANEVAAPAYNLQGQRVSNGYKGVVIVNGKKYMK